MAMSEGSKPTSYSSNLTELSKSIYDELRANGVYKQDNKPIEFEDIDDKKYSERQEDFETRVFNYKLESYSIAKAVIDYFKSKCDVSINGGQLVATYAAGADPLTGATLVAGGEYPVVGTVKTPGVSPDPSIPAGPKLAGKVS